MTVYIFKLKNGSSDEFELAGKAEDDQPYEHCYDCEMNATNGGKCHVADRYQRLPKDEYPGALGLCMKIGGRGC